jgi:hypothetical protein
VPARAAGAERLHDRRVRLVARLAGQVEGKRQPVPGLAGRQATDDSQDDPACDYDPRWVSDHRATRATPRTEEASFNESFIR